MKRADDNWVARVWYGDSALVWLLVPFSWLYAIVVACRRYGYRQQILKSRDVGVPVIVVGNITVGGTGKTPLTIWLARALTERGFSPAIVSRGYRGNTGPIPVEVTLKSDPATVGDEAILLRAEIKCPVVVHPDRVAAALRAVELGADVIIADDGLQHYRMAREFEIAVVDGERGIGNGRLLPAGPLREKPQRLASVDKVVVQGRDSLSASIASYSSRQPPVYFALEPNAIRRLNGSEIGNFADFHGQKVHAVAGIGNPERFFKLLESRGMLVTRHPLPDHAMISVDDVVFNDDLPVIMTRKDAVKCRFPEAATCWCVDAKVVFENGEGEHLLNGVIEKISSGRVSK